MNYIVQDKLNNHYQVKNAMKMMLSKVTVPEPGIEYGWNFHSYILHEDLIKYIKF